MEDKITVEIPLELAVALSEMRETYAPLLRAIGDICFFELYTQKFLKAVDDADIPSV